MVEQDSERPPAGGNVDAPNGAMLDSGPRAAVKTLDDLSDTEKAEALGKPLVDDHQAMVEEAEAGTLSMDHRCQMCGWDTKIDDVAVVTDEDKRLFIRSILSRGRFEKSYSRLGGVIEITVRSRTVKENDAILAQVERYRLQNKVENASELYLKNIHYQMVVGIVSITKSGGEVFEYDPIDVDADTDIKNYDEPSPIEKAGEKMMVDWDSALYAIVQSVSRLFDLTVTRLTFRAQDSDFWQGIATSD